MAEAKSGDDDGTGATPAAAAQPSTGDAATAPAADEPAREPSREPAKASTTTSATTSATTSTRSAAKPSSSRSSDRDGKGPGAPAAKQAVDSVRSAVATVVWVAAVLAALVLAAGALVVALDFNAQNGVVEFLTETADRINVLGDMKTFEPDGRGREAAQDARTKEVLVNWGICAVAYLVGGKILDKLIRP